MKSTSIQIIIVVFCVSLVSPILGAEKKEPAPFDPKKSVPPEEITERPKFKIPKNFYAFLGLKREDLQKNALAAGKSKEDAEKDKAINAYYKQEITRACKAKRTELKDKIDDSIKELKRAEELERPRRAQEIMKLQFELQMTTNFCPILLDPKRREAYNKKLGAETKEAAGYFDAAQMGVDEAMMLAPDKKVVLNQIIGVILADLIKEVPGPAGKIFNQNIALRSISILPIPYGPDVRFGIGFSGLMALNQFEVRVSVYIIQDIYGDRRASISVALPQHFKLSDLIPSITILDTFTFPKGKIIIANFEGIDLDMFKFKKGFNYAAIVDLTGPLAALDAFKDQSKKLKALVFEAKPIVLHGVINPFEVEKSSFTINVPLYFGIDLREIRYIPSFLSKGINQITTDELNLSVMPFKKRIKKPGELKYAVPIPGLKFRIKAEAGARIVLGTQKDPIRLTMLGLMEPPSKDHPQGYFSMGGNLKNMLEFKWLAIGNAGVQIDFDPKLMEELAKKDYRLPFTGLLARGQIDLGKPGDARAQLKVAGGFRATAKKIAEQLTLHSQKVNSWLHMLCSKKRKLANFFLLKFYLM